MQTKTKLNRIIIFDELRGFMLLNVILYHLLYDLRYLFGVDIFWFNSNLANLWQEVMSCSLIFISGACSYYSKNNLKRGVRILIFAMILTLATYIFVPEILILFGILHFLGTSMIIFSLLKPTLSKIPIKLGLVLSFSLFILTFNVNKGYILNFKLPDQLYLTDYFFPLGFYSYNFMSSDYFPLLPYFFMFLAGSYFGYLGNENKFPEFMYNNHIPFFSFVGRHSLLIYLLHQPIIYGVLLLLF